MHRLLKPRGLYLHHAIARRGQARTTAPSATKRAETRAHRPATSFPAASSTTSACRSPTWSATASRCTTSRPGASTTRAPRGCGTTVCCANRAAAEREVGAVKTRMWLLYLAGCSIGLRARHGRHLPDAGVEAHPRPVRPAAVAGGSVPVGMRLALFPPLAGEGQGGGRTVRTHCVFEECSSIRQSAIASPSSITTSNSSPQGGGEHRAYCLTAPPLPGSPHRNLIVEVKDVGVQHADAAV